jgi:hypothetical protein
MFADTSLGAMDGASPDLDHEGSLFGVGEFSFYNFTSGNYLSPSTYCNPSCTFLFKRPSLRVPFAKLPAANFAGGSNEGRSKFFSLYLTIAITGSSLTSSTCASIGDCTFTTLRDYQDDSESMSVTETSTKIHFQPEFNLKLAAIPAVGQDAIPLEIQNSVRFAPLTQSSKIFEEIRGATGVKGRRYRVGLLPYFKNYQLSLNPDKFTQEKRALASGSFSGINFTVPPTVAATGRACLRVTWDLDSNNVVVNNSGAEASNCSGDPWLFNP